MYRERDTYVEGEKERKREREREKDSRLRAAFAGAIGPALGGGFGL